MSPRIAVLVLITIFNGMLCAEDGFDIRTKYERNFVAGNTSLVCTKVDHPPKLDGTLNDPLWQQAGRTASAFTLFPSTEPGGRQTVVYCCYDDSKIYFAFDCEEKEINEGIDLKDIQQGDHVGVYFEVGDTRGRGTHCSIFGNRAGRQFNGPWRDLGDKAIDYACRAGGNRWIVQMGIPFKNFPGSALTPLVGELWGVRLIRYGRMTQTGDTRMQTSWPHIPAVSCDIVTHKGKLFFGSDNMLVNGALAGQNGKLPGWNSAADVNFQGAQLAIADGVTLTQRVPVRAGGKYTIESLAADECIGSLSVRANQKPVVSGELSGTHSRIDFQAPAGSVEVEIEATLKGKGRTPVLRMYLQLDDVPAEWICLTNNDWLPDRNLNRHTPAVAEGAYTYLKHPLYDFGHSFYRSNGCPPPGTKKENLDWSWLIVGPPTRAPLEAPPARPDIGDGEYESFPFETIYCESGLPEMIGLPHGAFDKGGMSGWIPFSKGSLTDNESWAGWPVTRWAVARPHDIVLDFKEKFFIRRIDVLQITSGFRNVDVYVRPTDHEDTFVHVFRHNGPGTNIPAFTYSGLPPYVSIQGVDSVARQVRISMGLGTGELQAAFSSKYGRPNCNFDLFGIAGIWVWGEPLGAHAPTEIKAFKPVAPPAVPPLQCTQLKKLPEPIIWPRPKNMKRDDGRFELNAETTIVFMNAGELPELARQLRDELERRFAIKLTLKAEDEAPRGSNCVWLGVKSISASFDKAVEAAGALVPAEEQGYSLRVTPERVLLCGGDVQGAFFGMRSLLQWADHDERTVFWRGIAIKDWPRLKLRTVTPSTDHARPIMPYQNNEQNYKRIVDALAYFRYTGLSDYDPMNRSFPDLKKGKELVQYATARQIEVRPMLVATGRGWPPECVELNPDNTPATTAGVQRGGTWEAVNLCPSNPETYREIEAFLDRSLETHPQARYIDLGMLGSPNGQWNVCRICRSREMDAGTMYAEFMNRVAQMCARRGKTAVFSNAFTFLDNSNDASRRSMAEALGLVNRASMLRIDRFMDRPTAVESGFWSFSRPWDTPWSLRGNPRDIHYGGEKFFDPIPPNMPVEGMLHIGEAADWWWWSSELSNQALWAAEEFWNGPAPDPAKHPNEYETFQQQAANVSVRFNEAVHSEQEYPSWRTGMKPSFFTVDMRNQCNRSHIDDGDTSGIGRSGPLEGMLAQGSAFDYRRIPLGTSEYAGVPFEIIDPAKNNWKSIVLVADAVKTQLIPGAQSHVSIPIGRKAASLCALRALARRDSISGGQYDYWTVLQPAYVLEYSDGTRYVCDRELSRHYAMISGEVFPQSAPAGNLRYFNWPATRVGLFSNTTGGRGAYLFLNEFVNPYPAKEIKNLTIQFPNPEQKFLTYAWHEALFAVTGVEPTEWDIKIWNSKSPRPLLAANAELPANLESLLAGCERDWRAPTWSDPKTHQQVASISFVSKSAHPTWQLSLKTPVQACGLSFRLSMPVGNDPGNGGRAMPVRYRHTDCTVFGTQDEKTWTKLGEIKGCTGMDGEHVIAFDAQKLSKVKFELDSTAYADEEHSQIEVLSTDVYVDKQKP